MLEIREYIVSQRIDRELMQNAMINYPIVGNPHPHDSRLEVERVEYTGVVSILVHYKPVK